MLRIPQTAPPDEAYGLVRDAVARLGVDEVAIVRNPAYVYAPYELYPLAPRPKRRIKRLAGVVKDMDGTTTTTEPVCLHALETAVRRVTNRPARKDWPGLDPVRDYPHVIGNSTTRHVEYLLEAYGADFDPPGCCGAFIETVAWTLAESRDPGRKRAVQADAAALGLGGLLEDARFRVLASGDAPWDAHAARTASNALAGDWLERFRVDAPAQRVRAMIAVYYARYHQVLADLAAGRGANRAAEILGAATGRLVEPMPGVGPLLAALKGRLGGALESFFEPLAEHVLAKRPDLTMDDLAQGRARLRALGERLVRRPVPVAVVTSSIAYEAGVVLTEVFKALRAEAAQWPVDSETRDSALELFQSPETAYDAVVTASDSSEIRLKPHRDLYSIALHNLGLGPEDFGAVLGFEDSESGVLAIRAAGVPWAVAVPFADTAGHDLSAAAHVLPGQIPEALLVENLFLETDAPEA